MGDALKATGRPIVYSLCQYGMQSVWEWGASVGGNLWRTTGDIEDNWKSMTTIGFDKQLGHEKYAGPGHWNDPDMLEIGNGGMNGAEYRTHMTLWVMLAAPLLAGNDLRDMSSATREILMNKEVIAIDQDRLGRQGRRVSKDAGAEMWMRPLENGDLAVAMFNRSDGMVTVSAFWEILGLNGKHKIRDLWAHADLGSFRNSYSTQVASHGTVLLRIAR
jgi:alpha-galactosidase